MEIARGLERISCPTLVMTGEEDLGNSADMAKKMAALIPGAHEVILPRTPTHGPRRIAAGVQPGACVIPAERLVGLRAKSDCRIRDNDSPLTARARGRSPDLMGRLSHYGGGPDPAPRGFHRPFLLYSIPVWSSPSDDVIWFVRLALAVNPPQLSQNQIRNSARAASGLPCQLVTTR